MSEALVPAAAEPVVVADRGGELVLPRLILDAGPDAIARFLEFFAARIANARTRAAYGRAVGQFLAWCEARGLGLRSVSPLHVAAYIRTHPGSVPTVKQHLAAIRVLCDWLVVSQVLPVNPAAAVRGPKHVVTKGATPVLTPAEARKFSAGSASTDLGWEAPQWVPCSISTRWRHLCRASGSLGRFHQRRPGCRVYRYWLRQVPSTGLDVPT